MFILTALILKRKLYIKSLNVRKLKH